MNKLIIGLIALFILSCAAPDRSAIVERTANFSWVKLRSRDQDGNFTTSTTMTFDVRHFRGAVTLWFNPDTALSQVAAALPDTCSTISLELYNDAAASWGSYYSGTTRTKLDTIDRAYINVDEADADTYIPLAQFNSTQWAWADKGRVTWHVGVGNIMNGDVWLGGQ